MFGCRVVMGPALVHAGCLGRAVAPSIVVAMGASFGRASADAASSGESDGPFNDRRIDGLTFEHDPLLD